MTYMTRFLDPPKIHERFIDDQGVMEITMELPEYNGKIFKVGKWLSLMELEFSQFDILDYVKNEMDKALWNELLWQEFKI